MAKQSDDDLESLYVLVQRGGRVSLSAFGIAAHLERTGELLPEAQIVRQHMDVALRAFTLAEAALYTKMNINKG